MKVFYNNLIPFKGFKAINLFGVLFVKNGSTINDVDLTHESIHTKQMKEMLYILFYICYVLEQVVRFISCGNSRLAYRRISFEIEAYELASRYFNSLTRIWNILSESSLN